MPDPTPQILELANRFRAQLLARERQAATAMVRYYGESWRRLQGDINNLRIEIEAQRAAGEDISVGRLWRLERMQAIQSQAEREMAKYAQFADTTITAGQREAIAAGQRNAHDLILGAFPKDAIDISFAMMPREAVEQLVGFLANGSPLRDLLTEAVGASVDRFASTMVTGIAAGWSPRRLARELRSEFGMGLTRSLRIARTEQLRAYRTATLNSYRESGVVTGWERLAALDTRTCMACIALDGTRYDLDTPMDDHVQGRCAMLPITKGYAELGIDAPEPDFTREKAQDWFLRQSEADQTLMMGPGAFEAWQAGQFKLEDYPKLIKSTVWGNAWVPKSLGELVDGLPPEFAGAPPPPPTPPRIVGPREGKLLADLAETREYFEMSGDEGVKGILDTLEETAKKEAAINDALWQRYGVTPEGATADQWRRVADEFEREGYDAYRRFTKVGIRSKVEQLRGAEDSGFMIVGKEQIRVRRGQFSVRTARRMQGQLWVKAKDDMRDAAGDLLQRAGFSEADISQASWEQRRRLLEELGTKDLLRTKRGTPSKIDEVDSKIRALIVRAIDYDLAATCEWSAIDPLSMPTIDAFQKMEWADLIRADKLGE